MRSISKLIAQKNVDRNLWSSVTSSSSSGSESSPLGSESLSSSDQALSDSSLSGLGVLEQLRSLPLSLGLQFVGVSGGRRWGTSGSSSMETDFAFVYLPPLLATDGLAFFLATVGSPLSAKCTGGRCFHGPSTMLGSVEAQFPCGDMLIVTVCRWRPEWRLNGYGHEGNLNEEVWCRHHYKNQHDPFV